MSTQGVWLFTRPGFESEGGQEWLDRAAASAIPGFFRPLAGLGLACFETAAGGDPVWLLRERMPVRSLVFVRDAVFELGRIVPLPKHDRVGALLNAVHDLAADRCWGEVVVHVPEGSEDRDISNFARKWTSPVARALRENQRLAPQRTSEKVRLDLILLDFEQLIIAESYPGHRAGHPGGRPRLKLPPGAPSRSTLKLEEALVTLLDDGERDRLLRPGMTAVDLGAAPGGWTFNLVRRGMWVTAVDNGPMDSALMQTGRVEHVQADGFAWLPDEPRDWMVCDIVDKPRRTVDLIARWLSGGHCSASVFNLKLPMKKRLEEWYLCRRRLEEALGRLDRSFELRAKQLYHDREEITVVVLPRWV